MDMTATPDPATASVQLDLTLVAGETVSKIERTDVNGTRRIDPQAMLPLVGPTSASLVDYEPALAGQVTYRAAAARTNRMPDPSFEAGTAEGVTAGSATTYSLSTGDTAPAHGLYGLSVVVEGASAGSGYVYKVAPLPAGSAGKWVGVSMVGRRSGGSVEQAGMYVNWMQGSSSLDPGAYVATWPLTAAPNAEQPRHAAAVQVPAGADGIRLWMRLVGAAGGGSAPSDGRAHTDAWMVVVADTEAEALAAVQSWDGHVVERSVTLTGAPPALLSVVDGARPPVPVTLITGYERVRPSRTAVYELVDSDEPLRVGGQRRPARGRLRLLFPSYALASEAAEFYTEPGRPAFLRQAYEPGLDLVHVAVGDVFVEPAHDAGKAWQLDVQYVEVSG